MQNTYTGDRMVSLGTNLVFALILVLLVLTDDGRAFGADGRHRAATVCRHGADWHDVLDIPLHQMSVTGLIISLGR